MSQPLHRQPHLYRQSHPRALRLATATAVQALCVRRQQVEALLEEQPAVRQVALLEEHQGVRLAMVVAVHLVPRVAVHQEVLQETEEDLRLLRHLLHLLLLLHPRHHHLQRVVLQPDLCPRVALTLFLRSHPSHVHRLLLHLIHRALLNPVSLPCPHQRLSRGRRVLLLPYPFRSQRAPRALRPSPSVRRCQ